MRNKAKDFPKTPFQGESPEEITHKHDSKRADGTINTRPQERMRKSEE